MSSTASGPISPTNYHTPWGDALNFDAPGSDEVRAFFIQNALMFLEEYRIDGFRIDAVHQIYDCHAQPFLAELARRRCMAALLNWARGAS